MKAFAHNFLVPTAFCVVCAMGGWALGRTSTPVHVVSMNAGIPAPLQPSRTQAPSNRSYDASHDVIVVPPSMNSCADPLQIHIGDRSTQI